MRRIRYVICLSVIITVLTVSQPTRAQFTDSMGTGWNNAMSASASTMIWNSIFYHTTGASKGNTRPSTAATAASQTSQPLNSTNPSAIKFRPTGTHIKTSELADSLSNTPAEREQYLKLMNAVLDAFGQKALKAGFPNDIATALAFFLGENIRIYRGMPELSDQQYVDLRNTIADALVTSGAVNTMTDRQKQEMYETLAAYTGITQYGYEQGVQAQNDAVIKGYQKVAGQNLQTVTKMSPDNINIGPNGLSAQGTGSPMVQPSAALATGETIDIYQIRHDYSENDVRGDQLYKGKRFVFIGTVVDVSSNHYKTTGKDETGRYIYADLGPCARFHNAHGTVIGSEVYCFFRNKNQLAQLRERQVVTFEATVEGRDAGTTDIILTDAVLR